MQQKNAIQWIAFYRVPGSADGDQFFQLWLFRNHPQPAAGATWHIGIIADGVIAIEAVIGARLHIQAAVRIKISRIVIARIPEQRTAYNEHAKSAKIPESAKSVACVEMRAATGLHAGRSTVEATMKTAVAAVESPMLGQCRTAGRGQYQRNRCTQHHHQLLHGCTFYLPHRRQHGNAFDIPIFTIGSVAKMVDTIQ